MSDTTTVNQWKDADYQAALKEIEGLMMSAPDTPEGERLDTLVALVEAYEASTERTIEFNQEVSTMNDNTYNGWTNHETWQAALWLNEEDFLGRCQENEVRAVDSEMLDAELYYIADGDSLQGLAGDIFNSWLSCVNLNEIADTFNQDLTARGEEQ